MTLAQLLIGKTPQVKVRICYRVLEKLRLRHNEMGQQFRDGKITEAQWKAFLIIWEGRHQKVCHVLNVIKENLNLFLEANKDTAISLKDEGRALTDYDADIDVNNIE